MCPICGNNQRKFNRSYLDKYVVCNICGGHFINDNSKITYEEVYFKQNNFPPFISKIAQPILNLFFKSKINSILQLVTKKSALILDYGCGAGKLVKELNSSGVKTIGFEPSSGALTLTKKEQLPVFQKLINQKKGYDLIMFWHSLEHIDQPLKTIIKIKKLLKKSNAKLLIAVPNGDSFEARIGQEKWFHHSYPLHRIQFTPKSISLMLNRAGFKVSKIDYFNPEYTFSGLIQTFLNFFLPKDVLYSIISHRRINQSFFKAKVLAIISIILIIIFLPVLFFFFIIQLIFKKTGAMVVTAKYQEVYENK